MQNYELKIMNYESKVVPLRPLSHRSLAGEV